MTSNERVIAEMNTELSRMYGLRDQLQDQFSQARALYLETLARAVRAEEALGAEPPSDALLREALKMLRESFSGYIEGSGPDERWNTERVALITRIEAAVTKEAAPYVMKPSEEAVFEKVRKKHVIKPDETSAAPDYKDLLRRSWMIPIGDPSVANLEREVWTALEVTSTKTSPQQKCYCDDHQGTNMYCPTHGTRGSKSETKSSRYCGWWGEGRGQCVLAEGHAGDHRFTGDANA